MTTFDDEFEEVPSPFSTTAKKSAPRKPLFNRPAPVGTRPSVAPVIETYSTRQGLETLGEEEWVTSDEDQEDPEVQYLKQNLPAIPRSSSTRKSSKKKAKWNLTHAGWGVVSLLILRLIFMERGVADYFSMEKRIEEKRQDLLKVKEDNRALISEINRISLDESYQRQLAKEHLGVIGPEEFLILFAGEAVDSSTSADRPL